MAIEVGTKVTGKVSGITNFGAFVDLADHKTGLVHISQVSNSFVKDIHDVLSVGDMVTVKVISIGDDGKIALSIKAANESEHGARESNHGPAKHYEHNSHNGGQGNDSHHSGQRNFSHNNQSNNHKNNRDHQDGGKEDFDSLLSGFLKESESRLSTLKHNTEGKRGGRGGRRS
ncbi:RNA-binding protein [Paucilactobacillus hokkaidonensis JCM 18461]|uniref:RNA-binding protein n=2 Tax=Paucilactobacillus hokkaidonensis TaxID=1193095 RepID=A0A0A1GSM1_9LACO|nr:S1 domain-containing RNA-binding protein [Paucilactobacillus hokkaidonensis]KRO09724.1 S1 RNA-binding domain-containing protein [Paucilactobacillus hokkaidonensis]BAP84980.1 RNA-binding protein [Paucilactobacillus hokkaidonensis JCM 18461]